MTTKDVHLQLDGQHTQYIKGVFTWNGTAEDLRSMLQDASVKARITPTDKFDADTDISFVLLDADNDTSGEPLPFLPRTEADPVGASTFVISVILIYGLSIIFLIASHVFIKKRAIHKENEKQINKYLAQAHVLKDASRRESFKKLKRSLIPVIARSPSGRTMIAKRVKYTPYLIRYLPFTALGNPNRTLETETQQPLPSESSVVPEAPSIPTLERPIALRHMGPLFQLVPFNGDVTDTLVHVQADSDEDDGEFYLGDTSADTQDRMLGQYLYGGRSLEDILKVGSDAELDSPQNASTHSVETIV